MSIGATKLKMGPAQSTVVNHTGRRMCVLSFDNSDLLCTSKYISFSFERNYLKNLLFDITLVHQGYNCLYLIEPGKSVFVEATPDAVGLKIGVVYDTIAKTRELLFQKFACKNESTIAIYDIDYDKLSWDGGKLYLRS